ncbi:hypothetical protein AGMMS49992_03730 [Clostridia bacterium]|nr:hypothetical protein AGMMS49992_03730 [Clostridia bacterium]
MSLQIERTASLYNGLGIVPAEILTPAADVDVTRWAVVACDQFTSQPEYWQQAGRFVGGMPSTLQFILPEVYLNAPDADERKRSILDNMRLAQTKGVFAQPFVGFVLVERSFETDKAAGESRPPRIGLVTAVDLELYDFSAESTSPIRATEGTIVERLPPRVAIRREAALELPHILLLLQDKERSVIEPVYAKRASLRKLYDAPLMLGGGSIKGWAVDSADDITIIGEALRTLPTVNGVRIAVGDGNHSLAAARAVWLEARDGIPEDQRATHPLHYALAEMCNVYDDGITFEPIHRIVYGAKLAELLAAFVLWVADRGGFTLIKPNELRTSGPSRETVGQSVSFIDSESSVTISITSPPLQTAVGTVQAFLDQWSVMQKQTEVSIDYIHGDDVLRDLASAPDRVGILLPALDKSELFPAIAKDGALPRKTFSMGHAREKRYYLEARRLRT